MQAVGGKHEKTEGWRRIFPSLIPGIGSTYFGILMFNHKN